MASAIRGTVCEPEGAEQIQSPDGEKHAGKSADERQQNTFGEHLPQQTRRPGAERDPDGEFAFTRSGAREQHGGQIRAGDQENERDRTEKNDQRRPHSADHLIVKFVERAAEAGCRLVVIRKSRQPTRDDGIDFRLRLRERHTRLEPADDAVAARTARLQIVLGKGDRLPDIDLLSERAALHIEQGQRKLESLRHDPDDGEAAPVERELLSDEFGIGIEPALPKTLADYDHVVVALAKFVLREGAAANRLHAEHGKQTRGHHGAGDPFGHFAGGEIEIDVIKARDLETLDLLFVIEIFRRRDWNLIQALRGKFLPQKNELLRVLVGQWANQQRVDQAEDGGVRADRERHGDDGDEGEARRVDQAPKGQAEILNHILDGRDRCAFRRMAWPCLVSNGGQGASLRAVTHTEALPSDPNAWRIAPADNKPPSPPRTRSPAPGRSSADRARKFHAGFRPAAWSGNRR